MEGQALLGSDIWQHGLENFCFQALGINDVTRVDISKRRNFKTGKIHVVVTIIFQKKKKKNKENIPND